MIGNSKICSAWWERGRQGEKMGNKRSKEVNGEGERTEIEGLVATLDRCSSCRTVRDDSI